MSKLVIKDEKQLLKFLSVLAEESVQQAYSDMSGDVQQKNVAKNISASKKTFIEEEDPPTQNEPPAEKTEPKQAAPAADQAGSSKASIAPKFDSLIDAINDLRGAPSSRDNTVEMQLRAYYDKLGEAEAASAILFIRTLSQVMKGEVEGASAPDPSDYQIYTKMEGEESAAAAEKPKVAAPSTPVESPTEPAEEEPEQEEESPEDTEPPIRVGATQVTESYRDKIRTLLARR